MTKLVYNRVKVLIAEKEMKTGHRITYRDITDATGLSKTTVGKWVRNEVKEYDREVIAKFLDFFNCPISDLLVYDQQVRDEL